VAPEHEIHRGFGALRQGRWSRQGRDYFLTICLRRPLCGLTGDVVASKISAESVRLENEGFWHVRTSVIMPDHVHFLATLIGAASLSDTVRFFKGHLSPALRTAKLQWQSSFYDRCIRTGDDLLPVFLYIFLNPYRTKLADMQTGKWPGYFCAPEDWDWFGLLTNQDLPFPEWLR
jgi:REP element-mobilizing transposase RayT